MKIFAFTDLHGDLKTLRKIKERLKKEKPEVIICAGDISIFGDIYAYLVNEIDDLGIPFLIIPGNHEEDSIVKRSEKMFDNVKNIHKKHYIKNNCLFLGWGGGGFSLIDKDFEQTAKKFKKTISDLKPDKIVLVTHAPPYKTRVDNIHGSHAGNKSIRNFIMEIKPVLSVCGHLHENEGKEDKIGKTRVINPGFSGKILLI
jgi:Icc-related predicted phosphoesterase